MRERRIERREETKESSRVRAGRRRGKGEIGERQYAVLHTSPRLPLALVCFFGPPAAYLEPCRTVLASPKPAALAALIKLDANSLTTACPNLPRSLLLLRYSTSVLEL